jgi:hypothetical protein
MDLYSGAKWTLCDVLLLIYVSYGSISRAWQKEYLHPVLHIFTCCQQFPSWTVFSDEAVHSEDVEHNKVAAEIISAVLIASTEFSEVEESPIFDLTYLPS